MAKLASEPIAGDGRANGPAHDEPGPSRVQIRGSRVREVHHKAGRARTAPTANHRGKILAPTYPPLGGQQN
jgi:hypothetical protein